MYGSDRKIDGGSLDDTEQAALSSTITTGVFRSVLSCQCVSFRYFSFVKIIINKLSFFLLYLQSKTTRSNLLFTSTLFYANKTKTADGTVLNGHSKTVAARLINFKQTLSTSQQTSSLTGFWGFGVLGFCCFVNNLQC